MREAHSKFFCFEEGRGEAVNKLSLPVLIALSLLLASCAATQSIDREPSLSVSQPTTPSETSSSQPESEQIPLQGPLQVLAESCETALDLGVEEVAGDSSFAYYLFPEELSIDGFSAVEHEFANDEVSLVWETDVFYVCYFANQIALADEFGVAASISFQATPAGFDLVDESFAGERVYKMSVSDGLITSVNDGSAKWLIRYGIDEEKVYLLNRAVEEFFG